MLRSEFSEDHTMKSLWKKNNIWYSVFNIRLPNMICPLFLNSDRDDYIGIFSLLVVDILLWTSVLVVPWIAVNIAIWTFVSMGHSTVVAGKYWIHSARYRALAPSMLISVFDTQPNDV